MARKKAPSKIGKNVKFHSDTSDPTPEAESLSTITQSLRKNLGNKSSPSYQKATSSLEKSVKPVKITEALNKRYEKNKVVFSSREMQTETQNLETKGWQRLSDQDLKEISQLDPYISAIISTRCSQAAVIGRPSESKFDKGMRIYEKSPLKKKDYTDEEYEQLVKIRQAHMEAIQHWVWNCGTDDIDVINTIFEGEENFFKRCSFADYIVAQMRNLLTFGRMATQIIRNEDGIPIMFRPVPVETIFAIANKDRPVIIDSTSADSHDQSEEDAKAYNLLDPSERPAAFVQKIDGSQDNFFTDRDLRIHYFQKQALFDLNGFPLSPIEMCVYMVFTHQQTLSYLRNHFIKGLANKTMINIEATDPAAQLSEEDLEEFRRSFHNFINRTDNSAATPIISGPIKVNMIPLSQSPKDMEFLELEDHIIRALCSSFQISPFEMGYGHLAQATGGLGQGSKMEEILKGEEKGLRMLLDTIFDAVNEIVYENFEEAKEEYAVSYTGVGEDSLDAVIERHTQELQTTATLSSLWAESEKKDSIPYGGDVPLSPTWHQNVVSKMKYGIFMEKFMGEKGASENPAYDFIIDPNLNEAYQSLKVSPVEMQQQQQEMQMKEQEMQMQGMQQEQEQAAQQSQLQQMMPSAPDQQQAPQENGKQSEEPAQKSLAEEFRARRTLQKSMKSYFGEWIGAQDSKQ